MLYGMVCSCFKVCFMVWFVDVFGMFYGMVCGCFLGMFHGMVC